LRAERVTIRCNSKNLRSAAVPRRAGFVHEATMRNERRDADGQLGDTELFAMTHADFVSRHS
jgi:RimJ/RimL family protein N-acetyltransferase